MPFNTPFVPDIAGREMLNFRPEDEPQDFTYQNQGTAADHYINLAAWYCNNSQGKKAISCCEEAVRL